MDRKERAEYLRQQTEKALTALRDRAEADIGEGPLGPVERACKPAMEALAAVREGEPPDPTELARLGGVVEEQGMHLHPQYGNAANILLQAGQGIVELAEEITVDP